MILKFFLICFLCCPCCPSLSGNIAPFYVYPLIFAFLVQLLILHMTSFVIRKSKQKHQYVIKCTIYTNHKHT